MFIINWLCCCPSKPPITEPSLPEAAIVWYGSDGVYGHAAFAYKGHLFGFASGQMTKEAKNLQDAINKAKNGLSKSFNQLAVLPLAVAEEKKQILHRISSANDFVSLTCMDAVSRILHEITSVRIPFFVGLLPNCSKYYLEKLQAGGKTELGKTQVYSKAPVKDDLATRVCIVEVALLFIFITGMGAIAAGTAHKALENPTQRAVVQLASFAFPFLVGLNVTNHLASVSSYNKAS